MSTPSGVPAINALLKCGDGLSPESFVLVANVSNITGAAGVKTNVVDTTSHSTSVPWKSQVATLLEQMDVTFDIFWDPKDATQNNAANGLRGIQKARTLKNWQIQWPPDWVNIDAFDAYVTEFTPKAPVANVLTASVKLSPSLAPSSNY